MHWDWALMGLDNLLLRLRVIGEYAHGIWALPVVVFSIWQWIRIGILKHGKIEAEKLITRVEIASEQKDEESIWALSPFNPPLWFKEHAGGLGLPIIAVGNLKGGVGKTTTSAYLAHCFSKLMGLRVLAIDLDYQGSLTGLLDETLKDTSGINKLLANGDCKVIFDDGVIGEIPNHDGKLFLVSASSSLASLENKLQLRWLLEREQNDVRYRLASHFGLNWVHREFDVIILDTPPRMTVSTFNALTACSHVIVPTSLKATSYSRVPGFIRLLTKIKRGFNPRLSIAGIAITLTHTQTQLTKPEQDIKSQLNHQLRDPDLVDPAMAPRIFGQHIPRLDKLAEADFDDDTVEIYHRLAKQVWEEVSPSHRQTT